MDSAAATSGSSSRGAATGSREEVEGGGAPWEGGTGEGGGAGGPRHGGATRRGPTSAAIHLQTLPSKYPSSPYVSIVKSYDVKVIKVSRPN